MKKRQGFVSNSSACSFTVKKRELSSLQYAALKDPVRFIELTKDFAGFVSTDDTFDRSTMYEDFGWPEYIWDVEETEDELHFHTLMDNFDMIAFAQMIGVPIHEGWHS